MFYDLDFSHWQSYVLVMLIIATFVPAIILAVWSLLAMYWWIMGDVVLYKRKIRKKMRD